MKRLRATLLLLALGAPLASSAALADDDSAMTASEIFGAGQAAYARGDWRAAALAFEAAFQKKSHGATMYNAGLAWQAAGEAARAADAYALALDTAGLPEAQASDARSRLAALDAKLGRLRIDAPAGTHVSVGHTDRVAAPATIHVDPGEHDVRADYAGGETRSRHVIAAAAQISDVVFEPLPAAAPPKAPAPIVVSDPGAARRTLGWVGIGVGAGLGATGAVFGIIGLKTNSDYDEGGNVDAGKKERATTMRTLANIAFVAGAVVGVAGLVVLLTAPSRPSAKSAAGCPGVWAGCGRF